ncbi:Shikimate kinase I [Candidatus Rhodobacter oscarellae]|uniref:Shikimate kinase n=1 Tax=Candidatus Rhodobacter oscarellae TaxID=1675527 RepID=A0A0J9GUE3_9RHOB|nr:shikimate kinase [Candidatus Rhodobacter lobularis]KMW57203.1 Shikimate kinase I [Candidatus Rhodobacter lobularis]
MTYLLKKTAVLVGMMGSGKTAVGSAVARMLNVAFLDSDVELVRAANMTIPEIFERDGEPFFRDKEAQVIARLLETQTGILSTGGGAFMTPGNRETISQLGVSVWLRADLELLWNRVRHKTTRPLLRTDNPRKTLSEIKSEREPIYALADLAVDADPSYSIEEMAQKVIEVLLTRPDVLERKT